MQKWKYIILNSWFSLVLISTDHKLAYVPAMSHECGAFCGLRIGKGNLPQCHFVHNKSHMIGHWTEPGQPANDRVSYDTATLPGHFLITLN
jgi:hypothetical protein